MRTAVPHHPRRRTILAWGAAWLLVATTGLTSTDTAAAEKPGAKDTATKSPSPRPKPTPRPGGAPSLAGPQGDAARSFVTPILANWVVRDADGIASASETAKLHVINPDKTKSALVRVTCHDLKDGAKKKMSATVDALGVHTFRAKFSSDLPRSYWCHVEAAHPVFAYASITVAGKHSGEGSYHPVVPLFAATP